MRELLLGAFLARASSASGPNSGRTAAKRSQYAADLAESWPEGVDVPPDLACFAFPDAEDERPRSLYFGAERTVFVLTEQNGTRRFGFSLRVLPMDTYRRVDSPPRARVAVSVLMSRPVFYVAFAVLESLAVVVRRTGRLPRAWLDAVHDIQLPQPGRLLALPSHSQAARDAVKAAGGPIRPPRTARGAASDQACVLHGAAFDCAGSSTVPLPCSHIHPWAGAPLDPLLAVTSSRQVVDLLCALLAEHRLLVVGASAARVSQCTLALASLLHPLEWSHILVPLLPPHLLTYTSAPTPYILGIRRKHFLRLDSRALDSPVVLDIDVGGIHYSGRTQIPTITADAISRQQLNAEALGVRLSRELEPLCARARREEAISDVEGRTPFLTFFARLLWRYRRHLRHVAAPEKGAPLPREVFQERAFMAEPHDASVVELLRLLMHTHMWHRYVLDRAEALAASPKPAESPFEHAVTAIGAKGWTWTPTRRFFADGWAGQIRGADAEVAKAEKLALDATSNTAGRVDPVVALRGVCLAACRHHCAAPMVAVLRSRVADAARHPRHGERALALAEAILLAGPEHSVFLVWRAVGPALPAMRRRKQYSPQIRESAACLFRLLCDVDALAAARRAVLWRPLSPWQPPATAPRALSSPQRLSVAHIAEQAGALDRGGRRRHGRGGGLSGWTRDVKGLKSVLAHSQQRLASVVAAAAAAVDAKQDHTAGGGGGGAAAEVVAAFPTFAGLHAAAAPHGSALRPCSSRGVPPPTAADSVELLAFDEGPTQPEGPGEGMLLAELLAATSPAPARTDDGRGGGPDPWDTTRGPGSWDAAGNSDPGGPDPWNTTGGFDPFDTAGKPDPGGPDPWDTADVDGAFGPSRAESAWQPGAGFAASAEAGGGVALHGWNPGPLEEGDLLDAATQPPAPASVRVDSWEARPVVGAATAGGGGFIDSSADPFSVATAEAFDGSQREATTEAWPSLGEEWGVGASTPAEHADSGGVDEMRPNPPSRPASPVGGGGDLLDLFTPAQPATGGDDSATDPLAGLADARLSEAMAPAPAAAAGADTFGPVAAQATDPFSLDAVEAFPVSSTDAGGGGSDMLSGIPETAGGGWAASTQGAAFDPFA